MTVYDIHLIQPENTDIELMPEELQQELKDLFTEYPSAVALNTEVVSLKKVIYARIQYDNLTEETLLALFLSYNLDWEVLSIREAYPIPATYNDDMVIITPSIYQIITPMDKAALLPYMSAIILDGDSTRKPLITDDWFMPMYAGTSPIKV